ncbi:hypothetical protein M378DRAFT_161311 [Amanita muscaria Koide BX008]|uniref:Uncharacterized protein n=1 Tax=Amanita muscaria (strain Koide BX008) TaxID=946122 RepID=A0A0C2XB83_AMAMK|nr:hypothetical protein M378DRAFT_161311 [Amanita muscaria Koide BX008]
MRLGVFYFCMCNDNVKLVPFSRSPVLQSVGINKRFDDVDAPTMEQWRKRRTVLMTKVVSSATNVEEEYINGVSTNKALQLTCVLLMNRQNLAIGSTKLWYKV